MPLAMPPECTAVLWAPAVAEAPRGLRGCGERAYAAADVLVTRMLCAYGAGHAGREWAAESRAEELEWMRGAVDAADGVPL